MIITYLLIKKGIHNFLIKINYNMISFIKMKKPLKEKVCKYKKK